MLIPKIDRENVYLDSGKLERLRIKAGLTAKKLKHKLADDISANTLDKALRGEGIRPDLAKIVADYFACGVLDLLSPVDPRYVPPVQVAVGVPWEWQIDDFLQKGGCRASNGLHLFLCRMKHRHTSGRQGRGKFYLLGGLAADERSPKRIQLQRHADVCARIGQHANLAENESSTPIQGEDGWWVVDRWIPATSLADRLATGRWPAEKMARLMMEIATGLGALHAAGVVMRELAPSRVLIAEADGRAVLTDFELAKLLGGAPTVSVPAWPDDPYRAPEVESGHATVQADLYSWARILVRAGFGELPKSGDDVDALAKLALPKSVWGIARDCLEPSEDDRPDSVAELLSALRKWK